MKFVQAPLKTKKKSFEKYRFYDEREWRVVPYITETDKAEVLPFLNEDDYVEYKETHNGNSLLGFGVEFQYEDIHYIIVESEADVHKTREIIGDKCHIFTKEEVLADIIGVNHHEEILPSPEERDYKAAMRHIERMRKLFEEEWNKRKKNSTNMGEN